MLKYFHWAELGTADRIHGKFIQWWVCYISPLIFTSPRHDIRKQMFICLRKRLYPVIIHVFSIQKSFKRRFENFSQLHSLMTLLSIGVAGSFSEGGQPFRPAKIQSLPAKIFSCQGGHVRRFCSAMLSCSAKLFSQWANIAGEWLQNSQKLKNNWKIW